MNAAWRHDTPTLQLVWTAPGPKRPPLNARAAACLLARTAGRPVSDAEGAAALAAARRLARLSVRHADAHS